MKYSVDRIEENIVVIENLETKEKKELNKKELPANIHEGTILLCVKNQYSIDETEEKNRLINLKNKFNSLKK